MRILVTGLSGYVGRNLAPMLAKRGHAIVDTFEREPDALIHLAWEGLPNYESTNHFENIAWQKEILSKAVRHGIDNITIAGTCLETVPLPPRYAMAKLAVRALAFELLPTVKWARLWYVYGKDQPSLCLLPRLLDAKRANQEEFRVVDGKRDFINVADVALALCFIAEQKKITGIIDVCSGRAVSVQSFCERLVGDRPKIVADRPAAHYEPYSFNGDNTKLSKIFEHA